MTGALLRAAKRIRLLARREWRYLRFRLERARAFEGPAALLPARLDGAALDLSGLDRAHLELLADLLLDGRIDLLGSGFVRFGYGTPAPGFEGHRYDGLPPRPSPPDERRFLARVVSPRDLPRARELFRALGRAHHPVDWQRDPKSGFRYSARVWQGDLKIHPAPGVDPKLPWEIGRLQHLPRLALLALALPDRRAALAAEAADTLLDFHAANPWGMGIQWACPLDVSLRAFSIALARDLLLATPEGRASLDALPDGLLPGTLAAHGRHIRRNLEWRGRLRSGNHYLGNLLGLAACGAWLPPSRETDGWLTLAAREFAAQVPLQFGEDGGHFEASTGYHLFALGMAASTALLLLRPDVRDRLGRAAPPCGRTLERLSAATRFLSEIRKRNGTIPLIGDFDSGCALRLTPVGRILSRDAARARYRNLERTALPDLPLFDEEMRSALPVLALCEALFPGAAQGALPPLESSLGRMLRGAPAAPDRGIARPHPLPAAVIHAAAPDPPPAAHRFERSFPCAHGPSLQRNGAWRSFPGFGLHVYRSDRVELFFRAGGGPRDTIGAHAHNDALAVELSLDGRTLLADPGTYVYGASPALRDLYRGARTHGVPHVPGNEPNPLASCGLFDLAIDSTSGLVRLLPHGASAELRYRGVRLARTVEVREDRILIRDEGDAPFAPPADTAPFATEGYGKLRRRARRGSAPPSDIMVPPC